MSDSVRSTIQKRDAKGAIRHGGEWLALWSDPDSMKTRAELRQEAAERGAIVGVEHQLAAAARSLSGDPAMQVAFGATGEMGGVFESLAADASNPEALSARRGEIDAYALARRFHEPGLHRDLAPSDPSRKTLFDLCEQVRCEAIGAQRFRGVADNLVARHRERLRKSDLLNAHLASLIPAAEGLRMVLRDSLVGAADPSIASSGFWMWDRWLRARFSSHLVGLRASAGDQASFAALSIDLIESLIEELGSSEGRERRFQPTADAPGLGPQNGPDGAEMKEDEDGKVFEPGGSLFLDEGADPLARLLWQEKPPEASTYAPYTTKHDLVVHSTELIDNSSLRKERAALERRRAEFRRDFSRIVSRLQRKLLARQMRNWSFDRDEGLIDASRLDRVIVNPGFASAYKQEEESEFRESVVSILIDNSGSMRGKPIEIACLVSDMISAALERCGVSCEISRLYHARLEGRLVGARLGARRKAGKSRPSKRHSAHHLQIGRRTCASIAPGDLRHDGRFDIEGEHRRRSAAMGFASPDHAARKPQSADRDLGWRAGRSGDLGRECRQGDSRPAFAGCDRSDRDLERHRTSGDRRQARGGEILSQQRPNRDN